MEELLISIEQRIDRLELSFDNEEFQIIKENEYLLKKLINTLALNPDIWTDELENICDSDETIQLVDPENVDSFMLTFIKRYIDRADSFSQMDFMDELYAFNLKEETIKQVTEILREALKNKQFPYQITYFDADTVRKMLDYQRFDVMSNMLISKPNEERIPDDIAERIANEFPFGKYPTPTFFASIIDKLLDHIDDLSYEVVYFAATSDTKKRHLEAKYTEEQLNEILVNKAINKKYAYPTMDENNIIASIICKVDQNKRDEFLKKLFDNNNMTLLKEIIRKKIVPEEEIVAKIIEYIKTNKELKIIYYSDYDAVVENFMKNKGSIIDALIDNGFVLHILENNYLDLWPEKEEKIIDSILHNPKTIDNLTSVQIKRQFLKYPKIIEALMYAPKLKSFIFTYFEGNNPYYQKASEPNVIGSAQDIILEVLEKKPKIALAGLEYINDYSDKSYTIAKKLLESKKISELKDYLDCQFWNREDLFTIFFNENKEQLAKMATTNIALLRTLFSRIITPRNSGTELLSLIINSNKAIESTLDLVNHNETYGSFYCMENYRLLKPYLCKKLNCNEIILDKFVNKFGPSIIKYTDNENIDKLLHLPEEELDKLINLFDMNPYSMRDLAGAYESLKFAEYSQKYPEVLTIFHDILVAIENNDSYFLERATTKIISYLDSEFYEKIGNLYTFPEGYGKENPKALMNLIYDKIKNPDKRDKYVDILHTITDYYIGKNKDAYRRYWNMPQELELSFKVEPKNFETEMLNYMIEHSIKFKLNGDNSSTLEKYLHDKLVESGIDPFEATEITGYHCGYIQTQIFDEQRETELKRYKGNLVRIMRQLYKEHPEYELFSQLNKNNIEIALNKENRLRKIYEPGNPSINIYDILSKLNITALGKVLENPTIYQSLKGILKKKKPHLLPENLKKIISSHYLDLSADFSDLAAFISCYSAIYEKVKARLASNNLADKSVDFTILEILKESEIYSSVSSIYSQILGPEDFRLIKSNPGPNAATRKTTGNQRLDEAIKLTEVLFRKQEVTIPTFNEVVEINDKKMRVVVGNFTSPVNLTHGERTGACMRIGGVGETLFDFAINNPNGFHIRFEDPTTGAYVSRVTGFRNGNTVFLNELRNTCIPESFKDTDVIAACRAAAHILIEMSKDSSCPIENVVVHDAYATRNMSNEKVNLGIPNIKEGLPSFYSDVGVSAIVLATTSKDKPYTPVNLDKTKVPTYAPARNIPKKLTTEKELREKIVRVDSIKRMLNGESYEYIPPLEFQDGLKYGIVNDDWYIYVDLNGVIHQDIIDLDPRAKEELAEYLIELEQQMANEAKSIEEIKEGVKHV